MGSSASNLVLQEAVARALELRAEGRVDWLESACEGAPEFVEKVRHTVERSASLPGLVRRAGKRDRRVGSVLDERFELLEWVGSGAMGVVYRARDLTLGRDVAVKVLRPGLSDTDKSMKRFAREAEAMASVRHAAVVAVYERGATPEGDPFIVMEFVEGAPLADVVERAEAEPIAIRAAVRQVAGLASGLSAVHAAGVLHRDIKPSNVILRPDGSPVLLDFGIALLEGDSTLTRGGTSVGTPSYMPPEALQSGRKRTWASDVYSLTATLYHMIAGHAPFEGTPSETLVAIATREPEPVTKYRPVARDLVAIVDKGLARRPESRYATAAALEEDLRAFLEHRPVTARPVSAIGRAGRRLVRSRTARGAAAAVLLFVGALAFYGWHTASRDARADRYRGIYAHLPPNLATLLPENRRFTAPEDLVGVMGVLDAAVDVAPDPLTPLLLRSSVRLDHGDVVGARDDVARIATKLASPFGRSIERAFDALPEDAFGSMALDVSLIDEPTSPVERYVSAFLALRVDDVGRAVALLDDEALSEVPHARELLFFNSSAPATSYLEEANRLEERLGRPTAGTCHLAGIAYLLLHQYSDAVEATRKGLDLAPRNLNLLNNLGTALFHLGRFDEAREALALAHSLQPHYYRPLMVLLWVERAEERFDVAAERLASAPLLDTPRWNGWRDLQASLNETRRALVLRREGESGQAIAAAAEAAKYLEAARAQGDPWVDREILRSRGLATLDGLSRDDGLAIFTALADTVTRDGGALDTFVLRDVLDHIPYREGDPLLAALRSVLETLVADLRTVQTSTRSAR